MCLPSEIFYESVKIQKQKGDADGADEAETTR